MAAPRLSCDNPPPPAHGTGYALTMHACKHCTGRIVQAGDLFRCSVCEVVAMGSAYEICGCSIIPKTFKLGRIRCAMNPNPSPSNPARVIISLDEAA